MTTVILDDALQARIQAVADPNEDIHAFIAAAARELIARREAQAILHGPRRPFAEADADFRERHNLPAFSHLTHEELREQAEAALEELPAETIAEAERLGLI